MTEDRFAAYRTAKSTRPAWANALIVAAVLFITAAVMTFLMGIEQGFWFFAATGVTLVVAGIAALVGVTRRVP